MSKSYVLIRELVLTALMVALTVVLSRFLSLQPTPFLRIGFSFLPVASCAMMFGPLIGGGAAAAADVVGFFVFPTGAYFPGITLSAFLSGAVYGLLLHRRRFSVLRVLAASAVTSLVIEAGLTTVWLYLMMPGKTFAAIFAARLIQELIMIPVKTALICPMWKLVARLYPAGSL